MGKEIRVIWGVSLCWRFLILKGNQSKPQNVWHGHPTTQFHTPEDATPEQQHR